MGKLEKTKDKQAFKILFYILIFGFLILLISLRSVNQAKYAAFYLDAIERYIYSYQVIEDKTINQLADLPDFHLVAPAHSFSIKSKFLRDSIQDGYVFDLKQLENKKYVLSASPISIFSPQVEFGITQKGVLKRNKINVDVMPDTYEEVESWEAIERIGELRTAKIPDYYRD